MCNACSDRCSLNSNLAKLPFEVSDVLPESALLTCFDLEQMIDKLPGKPSDMKTPLGELHWSAHPSLAASVLTCIDVSHRIFTAVTDTIAWNVLPRGIH